jgi:hypothetical protein
MKLRAPTLSILAGALVLAYVATVRARVAQAIITPAAASISPRAALDQYCVSCHNNSTKIGGIALDAVDASNVAADPALWEKVVAQLRAGMMPPLSAKRPSPEVRNAVAAALELDLDAYGSGHPFAGPAAIHRLSRTEYAAVVQDLLGVTLDPTASLPADQTSFGFDNNGEALTVTPALLQRYLSTAAKASGAVKADGDRPSPVFVCMPRSTADKVCARQILERLVRLGYRRPVTADDVAPLLEQFTSASSFDDGIRRAIELLLVDPEFLYRAEQTPLNARPGTLFRLRDIDLASRLSFLLWSSGPDDELITLAQRGSLNRPEILQQQTRRMLRDSRAQRFVTNFAGQWLGTHAMDEQRPDPGIFRAFRPDIRTAMSRELQLFLESEFTSDASVVNLLHADYTFVNGPLARFYGISGIDGVDFQRVTLQDPARFGLLGKGAVLLMTSYADRTSPVVRGKWILETLLGTPVPAAPPVVPPLPDADQVSLKTVRERLEQHRRNAACAACHAVMDPLGLALENFDATGKWRDQEGGEAIDAHGSLLDGTQVNGPSELHDALVGRSDEFVEAFAKKLFMYALGRGLDYRDYPAVRAAVRRASGSQYRWSAMIDAVVASPEFRMARRTNVITDHAGGGTR